MRIGATKKGFSGQTSRIPQDAAPAPAEPRAESRALVVIEPPTSRELPAIHRQAPFLAQLIATKAQHPQTRPRRRAEPHEALAAYRAAVAMTKWR
jgi:hypothetical protein